MLAQGRVLGGQPGDGRLDCPLHVLARALGAALRDTQPPFVVDAPGEGFLERAALFLQVGESVGITAGLGACEEAREFSEAGSVLADRLRIEHRKAAGPCLDPEVPDVVGLRFPVRRGAAVALCVEDESG